MSVADLMHRLDCEAVFADASIAQAGRLRGALGDLRAGYSLADSIAGVEAADLVVLVGTNPRLEAPTLNARLRKCQLQFELKVANVGQPGLELTYQYDQLGETVDTLRALADGSHPFSKVSSAATHG